VFFCPDLLPEITHEAMPQNVFLRSYEMPQLPGRLREFQNNMRTL